MAELGGGGSGGSDARNDLQASPSIDSNGIFQKSSEGIGSNYSHIDNKLSAAISFAESMGIDAHGNFNGMHRKRKIPKRLMEIGTRPLL